MTVARALLVPVPATSPVGQAPPPRPVDELSYEQAREELVTVVSRLEAGGETLEGSLALWERGEALAERCQQWLDGARRRLEEARREDGAEAGRAEAPRRPAGSRTGETGPGTRAPDEDEEIR